MDPTGIGPGLAIGMGAGISCGLLLGISMANNKLKKIIKKEKIKILKNEKELSERELSKLLKI